VTSMYRMFHGASLHARSGFAADAVGFGFTKKVLLFVLSW